MKAKIKSKSSAFPAVSRGFDLRVCFGSRACLLAAIPVAAAMLPRVAHGQTNNLIFQVTPGDYNAGTGALTPDVGPTGTITTLGSVGVQPNATPSGASALSFNGTAGFELSSAIPQTTNAITIFTVVLAAAPTGNAATILGGTHGNLQYRLGGAGGNANDQEFLLRGVEQFGNSSLAVSSSTFTVVDASNDPSGAAGTVIFNSNGVHVGDNNATGQNAGGLTTFGAADDNGAGIEEFFNGEIAEVQVYDGVLPTAQRQSIEASLESSFGIGVVNPNYNWVGTTGLFTTGSNWNQGSAPNNSSSALATISNGGTAQIVAGNTIGLLDFNVGSNTSTGVGSVVHTGGDLTVTQQLTVGNAGGTGTYNLSGGTITAGAIVVGSGGAGTFVQSGGGVTLTTDFEVGQNGGVGTYNMTGGSIYYSGPQYLFIYGSSPTPSSINLSGTAVITDSGQIPVIGYNPTGGVGAGVLSLTDSSSFTTVQGMDIGYQNSTGTLIISGNASFASNANIRIGFNGGTGVINMSGGYLTENNGLLEFGRGGVAVLNMTGGTITVNSGQNDLLLSEFVSGTVFNISGGSVVDNGNTVAGYRGSAIINLSGTTQSTQYSTNTLYLGIGSLGGSATFNLNGGLLTATTVLSQGGGVLNFNGGTLRSNGNTSALIAGSSYLTVNALAGGAFIDTNGYTATITASIGGPGSFTKVGAGTLVMSASNTYAGVTKISAGTLQLASPSLNLSFETPSTGGGFQYAPGGASWTFNSTGGNPQGAGIAGGNGFSFNGSPPDGTQAAFIQRLGSISQSFNFPATGTYTLSFYSEQRPNQNQELDVTLDTPGSGGKDLSTGGFYPNPNGFTLTTYTFTETAGSHTLAFVGLDPMGDDETAYVDDISFSPSVTATQGLNSYAVPSTSPVVIAAGATFDLNSEITTVGSLASLAADTSAAVTLGVGQLTIGGDGTSTNFAGSISGAGTVTKIGAGVQTFSGSNTYTGGTNVSGGTLVLASPGAFPVYTSLSVASGAKVIVSNHSSGATPNVLFVNGLTIAGSPGSWTGQIDLGNNDMVVRGGSLATVTSQVAGVYAYGNWNGPGGITSSAAAANTAHLTAVGVIVGSQFGGSSFYGQPIQSTDVLVKYTYYGDANLDGVVDGSDYSLIDSSYAAEHVVNGIATNPVSGWGNGDFNYDGTVDGSDYALIDNAFNNQTSNLSTAALVASSTAQAAAPVAVPEPATLAAVALALGGLARRSRRSGR